MSSYAIFITAMTLDLKTILHDLRAQLPHLLALYLFGSAASGDAAAHSDVDLAILVEGKVDTVALWYLAQRLASRIGRDVDLVDLRAASTVLQYQIITTGRCLWARDARAGRIPAGPGHIRQRFDPPGCGHSEYSARL